MKITLIFLFFLFSMVLSAESSINQLKKKVKNQQVSLTNIKKENKTIEFDNQRDIEDLRQLQCFESIEFSKCRSHYYEIKRRGGGDLSQKEIFTKLPQSCLKHTGRRYSNAKVKEIERRTKICIEMKQSVEIKKGQLLKNKKYIKKIEKNIFKNKKEILKIKKNKKIKKQNLKRVKRKKKRPVKRKQPRVSMVPDHLSNAMGLVQSNEIINEKTTTLFLVIIGIVTFVILIIFGRKVVNTQRLKRGEFISGDVIDKRLRVISNIGQGGFGTVYTCADLKTEEKIVAVKVFKRDQLKKDIKNEVSILARLNHVNICSVTGQGEMSYGFKYLVMDYIEGRTLKEIIDLLKDQKKMLPSELVIYFISEVSKALEYAASKKFLHRDICPRNIILKSDPVVMLFDFGIGKLKIDNVFEDELSDNTCFINSNEITQTGLTKGKAKYISPKYLLTNEYSYTDDIYSLMLVLFELVNLAPYRANPLMKSPDFILKESTLPIELDRHNRSDLPISLVNLFNKWTNNSKRLSYLDFYEEIDRLSSEIDQKKLKQQVRSFFRGDYISFPSFDLTESFSLDDSDKTEV